MAKKRKQPPQPAQSEEPPLKQQPQFDAAAAAAAEYKEEEHYEEEEKEESEEQQEEKEPKSETPKKAPSISSSSPNDDDNDEPIQNLLEPLGKDEIARFLIEAASRHGDVAERIRLTADADPAHRKIFVHGLGWDATADTLAAAFRPYGDIEDCKAVADKATGKSKGYGFVLFKSRRGARNALRQPQKKIGNRTTACQLAAVGPVQPTPSPHAAATASTGPEFMQRKIYVSNVGAELDPQRLLTFFARFGEIEEGPLGLDKVTGKPKGFCLFVYKSVEGARRALEVPHKKFEGHILHCQKAIDGNKQQRVVGAVQGSSLSGGFVGGGAAVAPGHLMAPAGPVVGGVSVGAAVNPVIGQAALTALLASRGAGLQLNGLLGIGSPAVAMVSPGGYGGQGSGNSGGVGVGGYGNQVGLQSAYASQQLVGIGGSGRVQQQQQQQQHGVGQYGGVVPYMGH